jgi:hypothetical protein
MQVRDYLKEQDDPKLFIIPSLESGRILKQDDKVYSFIDKAWIYYLNTPTHYYGAGASMTNKALASEVYTSISANTDAWEQVLSRSIGASHVLVPKGTWINLLQVQYQPHLERDIRRAIAKAQNYKPVISGSDYILLERTQIPADGTCIVDEAVALAQCQPNTRAFYPLQLSELVRGKDGTSELHTKDLERTKITLEAATNPKNVFYPSSDRLPYQEDMVEGSVFATTGPSLQVLRMEKSRYNLFKRKLPPMTTLLSPKFVGTTQKGLRLDYEVSGMRTGQHDLYMYALSSRDTVKIRVAGEEYTATAMEGSTDKNNYRYFHIRVEAASGYKVTITQETDEPLIVSHLYVRDGEESPQATYEELGPRTYRVTY